MLLAAGGFLAGARAGAAPRSRAEALWGTGPEFRIGLLAYLAGLVLLGWAWWRLGDRLRRGARPGLRWLLLTGALWAIPLLVAPPLGSRDVYAYACQAAVWLDGHDPYEVGAAAGGCPWLAAVPPVWQESTAPYGPVALFGSVAAVALARAVTGGEVGLLVAVGALRAVALAGALLVAWFLPRLARAGRVDPVGAAWLGLVTPLVALHVVAGAHNDALVAGLVVAGLALAVSAGTWRLAGAGAALGLAVAVKVTAVAALPFLALLAFGPTRSYRRAAALLFAAVAAFGAVSLGTGLGWVRGLAGTGELAQWSSLPTGLGMAVGYGLWGLGWPEAYDPVVALARVAGLAVLAVVAVALLRRAWRRAADPRSVVAAAGATLGAVVLLGPVFYPWYAVTPLAVLAASATGPEARRWLAGGTLALTALVLPSGLGVPVLTKLPGALLVAAGAVALSWWWLRRRREPSAGPVPGPAPPGR